MSGGMKEPRGLNECRGGMQGWSLMPTSPTGHTGLARPGGHCRPGAVHRSRKRPERMSGSEFLCPGKYLEEGTHADGAGLPSVRFGPIFKAILVNLVPCSLSASVPIPAPPLACSSCTRHLAFSLLLCKMGIITGAACQDYWQVTLWSLAQHPTLGAASNAFCLTQTYFFFVCRDDLVPT